MALPSAWIPLGAEPIAAVFGGIAFLVVSAAALVLCRNRLGGGPALPAWAWAASGALGGELLYVVGLFVMGRGPDLAARTMLDGGPPWAVGLVMLVGALVAYAAGARATWHPAGVAVLASLVLASTGWGAYLVTTRVGAFLAAPSLVSGALVALLFAQLVALLLVCAVGAYMMDGLSRRSWTREASQARFDAAHRPKVAVHVASYDEPPEIVLRTLESLVAQEYPRELCHVMLVDDSTSPAHVARLRAGCDALGVQFVHREKRAGYKAGALNAALAATPADCELVAVVDADFVAEPHFLSQTVGYFADPSLSFVQTKLDYSNPDESFTSRYATLMEHFFYTSMMRTRNEGNGILFCGTMGVLRKSAIVSVGGWTAGHVGEDVDLSCRILMEGGKSLYVPKVLGRGLQTPDQASFRRQQARWAYGGARILRDHGKRILTGRMTTAQKAHHLYGPIFWLDGSLALLFATSMILFAAAFLSGNLRWLPVRDLVFVGLVPILIILENMFRSAFTMRRMLGIRSRDVAALVLLGWSGKLANALAAWAALLGIPRPFHRTPKEGGASALSWPRAMVEAVRLAPAETLLCLVQVALCVAMTTKVALGGAGALPAGLILAAIGMTVVWACYFGAAPACAFLGHVSRGRWTPRPLARPNARPRKASAS